MKNRNYRQSIPLSPMVMAGEVRNPSGKLVCRITGDGAVEILLKRCLTVIRLMPDGMVQVSHRRIA